MSSFHHIALTLPFCAVAAMALAGCSQREVVEPGSVTMPVDVRFNWEHSDKAEVEGMRVVLFPLDEAGEIWRFDLSGMEGGRIEVPDGAYTLVAFNNDLPNVRFSDPTCAEDLFATAIANRTNETVDATGMLYRGFVPRVEVTPCGVSYSASNGSTKECPYGIVRVWPDSIAADYHVSIGTVSGVENLRSLEGRLEGLMQSVCVGTDTPHGAEVATDFVCRKSETDAYQAETSGFPPARKDMRLYLTLVAHTSTKEYYQKKIDVTEFGLNSPWPRNVFIDIGHIAFTPDEMHEQDVDVGSNVGVEGWQEVEIDYETPLNL